MARASKRDHIVTEATELFLQQGFKGTSIDLVVSTCAVSKPTVYNHFPDKAVLMAAVIDAWLANNTLHNFPSPASEQELWEYLTEHCWDPARMAMYRLVIAEGWRFAQAADRFWQEFDAPLQRLAMNALTEQFGHTATAAQTQLEARRWQCLVATHTARLATLD